MSCPMNRTNLVLALILAVAGAVLVTRAARGDHAISGQQVAEDHSAPAGHDLRGS